MNKYLKFEYWNTCDLGNIYYQGGQHFWFYLDGDVLEPFHEDTEEGQENGEGDFIPTLRRQMKRYRIKTGLVPDYLIDAMQRMKLHDNIELTFKTGEVEQVYNLDIEPEWQFEKFCWQGTITMVFNMDEKVVLGACCDNLTVGGVIPDPEPIPDLYWVAQTGSNVSGDGSYANPWATFGYASTQATVSGDVIHMKAGMITETVQSSFALGVSIIGAGDTSIIKAGVALNPMFIFQSTVEGTNGNQSISYVKFDGDLTVLSAMSIYMRKNVEVHHVTFVDFLYTAIDWRGGATFETVPTTFATGNKVYSCTIDNCCERRDPGTFGALRIAGQSGMEVHDNTMSQISRAIAHNGNLLYLWGATNRAFKFYNNICTKPNTDGVEDGYGDGWNFHIESGNSSGFEVYGNTFTGGTAIDLAGGAQTKGAYTYAWHIHDNIFRLSAQIATPAAGTHSPVGIDFERTNEDILVERNFFENYPWAINFTMDEAIFHKLRIHFNYNIFNNLGYTDNLYAFGVHFASGGTASGDICSYIYFDNNVFKGNGARELIHFQAAYNIDHIYIRNNIAINAVSYGWLGAWDLLGDGATPTGTLDNFVVQNNLLYNNANADAIYYRGGKTITNLTGWSPQTNILADNPDFVSAVDFHLQAGSPAINAGIYVGITLDHDGQPVANPPEIGAYEY